MGRAPRLACLDSSKSAAYEGKAIPRHINEYLELPFEVLNGDLMIGLFGELHYG